MREVTIHGKDVQEALEGYADGLRELATALETQARFVGSLAVPAPLEISVAARSLEEILADLEEFGPHRSVVERLIREAWRRGKLDGAAPGAIPLAEVRKRAVPVVTEVSQALVPPGLPDGRSALDAVVHFGAQMWQGGYDAGYDDGYYYGHDDGKNDRTLEIKWAPYQEFGIPDIKLETLEAPPHPVTVKAVGCRGLGVIVYWEKPSA
jgi:hypothetical protein